MPYSTDRPFSHSNVSLFRECKKKWYYKYVDDLPQEEPSIAILIGSYVHNTLEELFNLEPDKRTKEAARLIAKANWNAFREENPEITDINELPAKLRMWQSIENLWNYEDPALINVYATEKKYTVSLSEEVSVVGVIDRIDIVSSDPTTLSSNSSNNDSTTLSSNNDSSNDDSLRGQEGTIYDIVDYKTSAKPPVLNYVPVKLTQVLLYAAILRSLGYQIREAKLYFLDYSIISVDVTNELMNETLKYFLRTCGKIQELVALDDREAFKATVSPLCRWCPYIEHCTEGQAFMEQELNWGKLKVSDPAVVTLGWQKRVNRFW